MSINADSQHNLANLLYPSGNDGRVSDESDSHGLMEYLQHDYQHPETGDIGSQARTDHSSSLAPLPGDQLSPGRPTGGSGTSSPQPTSNRNSQQPSFNAYHPGEIRSPLAGPAAPENGHGVENRDERRSASPPNSEIPIPSSLAKLASEAISSLSLPDPNVLNGREAIEQAALLANQIDRGEMGGKRRKLPHERAGWKEMDEQSFATQGRDSFGGGGGSGSRRKKFRKTNSNSNNDHQLLVNPDQDAQQQQQQQVSSVENNSDLIDQSDIQRRYENDFRQLTEISNSIVKEGLHDAISGLTGGSREQSQPKEATPTAVASSSGLPVDPSLAVSSPSQPVGQANASQAAISSTIDPKLSRAEQNKRAQQAFRRRREEHMKQLEMDSAQLELVKKQMTQKDALLRDLVLTLESSKIEIAALRSSIQYLIPNSSVNPLTVQGTLNLGEEMSIPNDYHNSDAANEPEISNAFQLLEKQAREVAKRNRSRRE